MSDDISSRTHRYLVMMGIRTACFATAVFTSGWLRWASIVGAVVLPYLAVVVANAGREPDRGGIEPVESPRNPAIEGGRTSGIRTVEPLPHQPDSE